MTVSMWDVEQAVRAEAIERGEYSGPVHHHALIELIDDDELTPGNWCPAQPPVFRWQGAR